MAGKKAPGRKEIKNKRKKVQIYVYLGPILLNGKYRPGQNISDIPEDLKKYIEKQPLFKSLIVKIEDYPRIKKQNSATNAIYKKVNAWLQEGENK